MAGWTLFCICTWCNVQVRSDLKRRHQRQLPVVGVQQIKVELISHPIEFLLDGGGHGFFHLVSAGTQVACRGFDRARGDLWLVCDREPHEREQTRDHDRQQHGKDRALDEKLREHSSPLPD
jgi:hypothetical protein